MTHLTDAIERLRILVHDPAHALTSDWLAEQCGCSVSDIRYALSGDLNRLPDGNHQFLFELDKAIRSDPSHGARPDELVAHLTVGRPRKAVT